MITLKEYVEKSSTGSKVDKCVAAAKKLGIGHWTLYRVLKNSKPSRAVASILESKGITLG
jgi:hypothetical protein